MDFKDELFDPNENTGCVIFIWILLLIMTIGTNIMDMTEIETVRIIDIYPKDNALIVVDIKHEEILQVLIVLPKDLKKFKINDIIHVDNLDWYEVLSYDRFQQRYTDW